MNTINQRPNPITLVISEIVKPNRIQEYEAWSKGINQAASQFEGFLGVDVIRPRDHGYSEYVVVVKFNSYVNFRNWLASPTYREWMANARDLVVDRSLQQRRGIELWFTLPKNESHQFAEPAYYKKVVLGVLAVYPLILFANAVLGPFLKSFPPLLGLLISVTFVSALLTYPVMPWLTRSLGFWLYPSASKRR